MIHYWFGAPRWFLEVNLIGGETRSNMSAWTWKIIWTKNLDIESLFTSKFGNFLDQNLLKFNRRGALTKYWRVKMSKEVQGINLGLKEIIHRPVCGRGMVCSSGELINWFFCSLTTWLLCSWVSISLIVGRTNNCLRFGCTYSAFLLSFIKKSKNFESHKK